MKQCKHCKQHFEASHYCTGVGREIDHEDDSSFLIAAIVGAELSSSDDSGCASSSDSSSCDSSSDSSSCDAGSDGGGGGDFGGGGSSSDF